MTLMNQDNSSTTDRMTLVPVCDSCVGKEIHYGLMILIELAGKYYSGGCKLTHISKKHGFALCDLIPIVYALKEACLIDCRESDSDWWSLNKEPHDTWILEVVPTLKFIFHAKKR